MTKNFKSAQINLREPKVLVRAALGVLLVANLVVAAFAFHLIGDSPADLDAQLAAARTNFRAAQQRLNKSKNLIGNMEQGRAEGANFLATYMTNRRVTYSTIGSEINKLAQGSGMKVGDLNYSLPEPIENTDDLYMLSITGNFEGNYAALLKFVNALDRSSKFLILESLLVTPQPKGDILTITVKLDIFVDEPQGGVPAAEVAQ
jgi:hypothetical protein